MWPHFAWSVRAPRVSPDDLVVSNAKLRPSTFIFTVLESFSLKNGAMSLSILTRPLPTLPEKQLNG